MVRSYEHNYTCIEGQPVFFEKLGGRDNKYCLSTIVINVLPMKERQPAKTLSHYGEEFIYVLEGILTTTLNDVKYDLYPGDSLHFQSSTPHSWENTTNKLVRFLSVYMDLEGLFSEGPLRGSAVYDEGKNPLYE